MHFGLFDVLGEPRLNLVTRLRERLPGRDSSSWRVAKIVLNLVLVGAIGSYIYLKFDGFGSVKATPWPFLGAVFASGAIMFFRACTLRELMGRESDATIGGALEVVSTATACNLLLPTGVGSVYIFAKLKQASKQRAMEVAALQSVGTIMIVVVDIVLVIVGMLVAGLAAPAVLAFYLTWLFAIGMGLLVFMKGWERLFRLGFLLRIGAMIREAGRRQILGRVLMWCACEGLSMAAALGFCIRCFRDLPGLGTVLFFTGIRDTSILLSLTPGALGISEFILQHVSSYTVVSGDQAVLTGLALRVAILAVSGLILIGASLARILRARVSRLDSAQRTDF